MALKELYTEVRQHQKKEFTEINKLYEQKLTEKEQITRRFLRLELTLSDLFWEISYVKNVKEFEETLEEFEELLYSTLLENLRAHEKMLEMDTALCGEEYIKENVSQLRQLFKDFDDKYNMVRERKYRGK
ncbi:hypothetical protein [Peribacillus butanolivorans]|uniref:hypothetical protein n=1 Tax=Peribacillus butanolivorans TaxID=421767 RepID=UPI0035D9B8B8